MIVFDGNNIIKGNECLFHEYIYLFIFFILIYEINIYLGIKLLIFFKKNIFFKIFFYNMSKVPTAILKSLSIEKFEKTSRP